MPIESFHQLILLTEVVVDKDDRQRSNLGDVANLAASIKARGLLHPIILERGTNKIIAGERRLTAFKLLDAAWAAENPGNTESPWRSVPYRYFDALDGTETKVVELEENLKRQELLWQEVSLAVASVHDLLSERNPDQTGVKTAEHIGMEVSLFRKHLLVAEELRAGNKLVSESVSIHEAYNKVKRGLDRATSDQLNVLLGGGFAGGDALLQPTVAPPVPAIVAPAQGGPANPASPHAGTPATPPHGAENGGNGMSGTPAPAPMIATPPAPLPVFLNTDFIQWADSYTGEPFNFIHCDFPYGINHQKSRQGRTASYGTYADGEDVYWALLECLARNKSKLIYPSAHMVFWFSMNFYSETMDFFEKHFPEFTFDPFPLIWWKDRGIAPDTARRPRRVYETALFGFSNERQLISSRANLVQAGAGTAKIHASEKAAPMLATFFKMIVDRSTRMLDPTCGSGASIRAAKALGAGTVLGIERDPTFYAGAVQAYQMAQALNFAGIVPGSSEDE